LSIELIDKYFPKIPDLQRQQLAQLEALYLHWNAQINVVSRKDLENLYERHVLHSLGIAKVIQFKFGTVIVDVGTGGGFPGIPLAILFPDCEFHLIDSIGKKIKVVAEITHTLGLTNVSYRQIRAEQLDLVCDFVVSRGVTHVAELRNWVRHSFNKAYQHNLRNGMLLLKGGDLEEEIREAGVKSYKIFELKDYFQEEFFQTKKVLYVPA
jgi:16S rRNA (guanine527-N7)-methyltransferase